MIEKLLEDKIIEAVKGLKIPHLQVIGSWSLPTDETAQTVSTLGVIVAPRIYSRYTVCEATFPVLLELSVSAAVDKKGEMFLGASTAISDMLHTWNMNKHNEAKTALAVKDKLSIGGIKVEGGEAPSFDQQNAKRSVTIAFSVTGFIAHTT